MCLHELSEFVTFHLLVGSRQTSLLLALIVHHLLDDRASFAIEVTELRILGLYLLGVDLCVALEYAAPPVLALLLSQRDLKNTPAPCICLQTPDRVALLDGFVELTVDHEWLALESNL